MGQSRRRGETGKRLRNGRGPGSSAGRATKYFALRASDPEAALASSK